MNARFFFQRLDVVRNYCRCFLLIGIFLIWSAQRLSIAFCAGVVIVVISTIGSIIRVPKPEKIAEFVSDAAWEFESKIRKCHTTYPDADIYPLHAFSPTLFKKARNIGNKMYFPECCTLVFCRKGERLDLFVQTIYLYEKEKPSEQSFHFTPSKRMELYVEAAQTDEEYHFIRLKQSGTTLGEFYVPNTHAWENILNFSADWVDLEYAPTEK